MFRQMMTDLTGSEGVYMARIVSQDGHINMPADYTVVYVEDCTVMAVTVDSPFGKLMATYSSGELAEKAFRRMGICLSLGKGFTFPTEEMLCAD